MFDKKECKQSALAESKIAFFGMKENLLNHEREKTLSDKEVKALLNEFIRTARELIKIALPLKNTNYNHYFVYIAWKNILMRLWSFREEKYPRYVNTKQRSLTVMD